MGFKRTVEEEIKLSDGKLLPKHAHIMAVVHDAPAQERIPFDGFRWAKQREIPGEESNYQYPKTGLDSLHFGHGKYACPGRFFATDLLKVLLGEILLRYDIGFEGGSTERPVDDDMYEILFPNHSAKIVFQGIKSKK